MILKNTLDILDNNYFFSNFPTQKQIFVMKNNKNIDAMQMHMNKNNLLQIYEFYVICDSFN